MTANSRKKEGSLSDSEGVSRRQFLSQSAVYSGTFLAILNMPRPLAIAATEASSEPVVFSGDQWRLVKAITGRIIPTDHEPGAIEANCVNFIDKALANEDKAQKPLYDNGLATVDAVANGKFDKDFLELTVDQQDEVLESIESGESVDWPFESGSSSEFFGTIRGHSIIGFLADPKYGGNLEYSGWKVIGYPGPSHHAGGYSPAQLVGEAPIVPIWEHKPH